MNKIIFISFLVWTLAIGSLQAQNNATNICNTDEKKVAFLFFNGVWNTKKDARNSMNLLKQRYGNKSSQGDTIVYEVMYNTTKGKYSVQDIAETFAQKLKEKGLSIRYEIYYLLRVPYAYDMLKNIPWIKEYIEEVEKAKTEALKKMAENIGGTNQMQIDYAKHRVSMEKYISEGYKLLLTAHSQGNLFANKAYGYVVKRVGENGSSNPSNSVKAVHIAPASNMLKGGYVLADVDWVIRSIVGHKPNAILPTLHLINDDFSGHRLDLTYLNSKRITASMVDRLVRKSLATLQAPPKVAKSGFVTGTLTWNGSGDVDFHIFEPSGSHVYYANMRGNSGYLDVDNTVANGPEHYYIGCDVNSIQEGIYTFKVANYARADGKVATVQIDLVDGVKRSKSVALGGATRNKPTATFFQVKIKKKTMSLRLLFYKVF